MSLTAGTMRRTLRGWGGRVEQDEENWIPTSKRSLSFIVRGHVWLLLWTVVPSYTIYLKHTWKLNYMHAKPMPCCSYLELEILVRKHYITTYMRPLNIVTHSHQRHYSQPEGPKDVHQAAGTLAPDQHGLSQGHPHCPLPRTDLYLHGHQQLPAGRVPTAAWSVVTALVLRTIVAVIKWGKESIEEVCNA